MSAQSARKGDSAVVNAHFVLSSALIAGVASFQLSPSGMSGASTRLLAEADSWAHFRVKKFKFRLIPVTAAATVVAGFVGGLQDTTPATVGSVMELLPACIMGFGQTFPSSWSVVKASELAGPFPWYKSVNGGADASEEGPGVVCLAGASTSAFLLEAYLTLEFKTAVAPANTPSQVKLLQELRAERLLLEREKERLAILKVLSPVGIGSTTAKP